MRACAGARACIVHAIVFSGLRAHGSTGPILHARGRSVLQHTGAAPDADAGRAIRGVEPLLSDSRRPVCERRRPPRAAKTCLALVQALGGIVATTALWYVHADASVSDLSRFACQSLCLAHTCMPKDGRSDVCAFSEDEVWSAAPVHKPPLGWRRCASRPRRRSRKRCRQKIRVGSKPRARANLAPAARQRR